MTVKRTDRPTNKIMCVCKKEYCQVIWLSQCDGKLSPTKESSSVSYHIQHMSPTFNTAWLSNIFEKYMIEIFSILLTDICCSLEWCDKRINENKQRITETQSVVATCRLIMTQSSSSVQLSTLLCYKLSRGRKDMSSGQSRLACNTSVQIVTRAVQSNF